MLQQTTKISDVARIRRGRKNGNMQIEHIAQTNKKNSGVIMMRRNFGKCIRMQAERKALTAQQENNTKQNNNNCSGVARDRRCLTLAEKKTYVEQLLAKTMF